jgi:hypothetical protein
MGFLHRLLGDDITSAADCYQPELHVSFPALPGREGRMIVK